MKETNRSIHFIRLTNSPIRPSSIHFGRKEESQKTGQTAKARHLSFSTGFAGKPETVSFQTSRCSEKGCVYPAASPTSGKCSYHTRQEKEPTLFRSHQPTGLLLDPARMSAAEKEFDGSRKRDRRRMVAIWEQFQSDGTP